MLSRFVIVFLPRSKCLLISWLQSSSAGILEPSKIKSATVSIVSHLFAMKWWDWMPWSWNGSKIKVPNYSNNFLLSLLLVCVNSCCSSIIASTSVILPAVYIHGNLDYLARRGIWAVWEGNLPCMKDTQNKARALSFWRWLRWACTSAE